MTTKDLFGLDGFESIGDIVIWNMRGEPVPYADVLAALDACGLPREAAGPLTPKGAFSRAAKTLEKNKLVRPIKHGGDQRILKYQVTLEIADQTSNTLDYTRENLVDLDRETGEIFCSDPAVKEFFADRLAEATNIRTGSDLTAVGKKIFESRKTDSFRMKEDGGVYFVPKQFSSVTDAVDKFLRLMGRYLTRTPIPKGSYGEEAAKDAAGDGIKEMIEDISQAVSEFDEATKRKTLDGSLDKLREAEFKIQTYIHLLGDRKDELLQALEDARAAHRAKAEELFEDDGPTQGDLFADEQVA